MIPLMAVFVGLGAGAAVVVAGVRGVRVHPSLVQRADLDPAQMGVRCLLAGVGAAGAWMLTGWPVALVAGAIGGGSAPVLRSAGRRRRESIERTEAVASWVETIRDGLAASAGITDALQLAGTVAPPPIATEVRRLASRVRTDSVPAALASFADDLGDATADTVAIALILATRRQAGNLNESLTALAAQARETAAMRRRIEASRARSYGEAKLAAGISIGFVVLYAVTRREFLAPFDSGSGQLVLAVIVGLLVAAGVMMYRLGAPQVTPRHVSSVRAVQESVEVGR
jgi:Flp pilus assembly protein TadB